MTQEAIGRTVFPVSRGANDRRLEESEPIDLFRSGPLRILPACMIACFIPAPALAQTPQRVPATVFAREPARFLNQLVRVDDFACWSSGEATRCASGKALDVIPRDISPAASKKQILEQCGENDALERSPGCVFDLVFTPTALSKGPGNLVINEVVSTGQVWIVQTGSVTTIPRR